MADVGNNLAGRKCAECGTELPSKAPGELCPKCLLKAALETQPVLGPTGTIGLADTTAKALRGLPNPGEQFGHYRMVRLLGRGGMGAAFEAEDLENGRRVALKVLSHALDSPEARERFFREGRLAASINHPNSVYVFGTEEIGGTPVISMELVSGGTLQERVSKRGALPVGEAVDAVLQIIAGLDAAQQVGILHRDVKPSNCFRDAGGAVKIGDFGLSISTNIRTEPALTATGAFLGTPAFCSPEQLRGDELNARADMYSVGATLFYLLTGRTPFEGRNTVQLMATVLEQRAPSPRKFRANIPKGLARVVLRCLEKQPGDRFRNYSELTGALTPYSSTSPTPATLGLRFLAGALDQVLLGLATFVVVAAFTGEFMGFMNVTRGSSGMLAMMFMGFGSGLGYYAVMEGLWGCTIGKFICRLRVVGRDKSVPGLWRALGRAAIYVGIPPLPYMIVFLTVFGGDMRAYMGGSSWVLLLLSQSHTVMLVLLFCTARRRNGFAAIHDLLTKTRVIARAAVPVRPVTVAATPPPSAVEANRMVGPYHVLETLEETGELQWLLGYDLRLLRKVWLRVVPPGTPPFPTEMRNVGRAGRLRWLTGRRSADWQSAVSPTGSRQRPERSAGCQPAKQQTDSLRCGGAAEENWDAFEAVAGNPLLTLARRSQPWSQVRFWLFDLANELSAAEKDGTLPQVLALDRVWIGVDGRAKLLDFPAPTTNADSRLRDLPMEGRTLSAALQTTTPLQFLDDVATAALKGRESVTVEAANNLPARPPLHAQKFLQRLVSLPDTRSVAQALQPLLRRVAEISRLRRAAIVAGCLVLPVLATSMMFVGAAMMETWNARVPGLMELNMLLHHRDNARRWMKDEKRPTDEQFAIYIAHHHRSIITNDARWTDMLALSVITGDRRRFAERSVAEHPSPTSEEVAAADAAIKPLPLKSSGFGVMNKPWFPLMAGGATLAIYVAIPALIAALLFRGGLILLATGVTFVRRDGARASRLRVFGRSLIAWSPLLVALFVFGLLAVPLSKLAAAVLAALFICIPAVISIVLPNRGLADRLAGTWPVPR